MFNDRDDNLPHAHHERKDALPSSSVLVLPMDRLRYLPAATALLMASNPDEVGIASAIYYEPFNTTPLEELGVTVYTPQALVAAWRRYLEMAAADRDADFGRPPLSLEDLKAVTEGKSAARAAMFVPTPPRPFPQMPPELLSKDARKAQDLRSSIGNDEEEEEAQMVVLIPDAWPTTPVIERAVHLGLAQIRPDWSQAVVESVYTPPAGLAELQVREAQLEAGLETARSREEYKGLCSQIDRLWIEEIAPLEQQLLTSRKLAADIGPDYDREFESVRRQAIWSGRKPLPVESMQVADRIASIDSALLELEGGMANPQATLDDLRAQLPWADDFPELPIRESVAALEKAVRGETIKPWRR